MAINGIRYNDLEDGTNLEDVRRDVEKILNNNVVIGININSDLNALGLNVADYTDGGCFDLQEEYKGEVINNGVTMIMGHSLKSLYQHFYGNCEFQSETHGAEADALATMQIFREKYIPFKRNEDDCHSKRTENIYNMINRLPRSY
jgi:DNA polymerase III epsilon subunit-like protein